MTAALSGNLEAINDSFILIPRAQYVASSSPVSAEKVLSTGFHSVAELNQCHWGSLCFKDSLSSDSG